MLRMPFWSHDQAPTVQQRKTGKYHQNGKSTGTIQICGPTGVTSSRVPIQTHGQNDQSAINIWNKFCGPLQLSKLCTPADQPNIRREIKFMAIFWVIHSKISSDNKTLSHEQQTTRTRKNNVLLWIQLPLPKQNIWKDYQGPEISRKKEDIECQIKMKSRNRAEPVALHAVKLKWDHE